MANYQELANLVWNVADDVLRGLFKPHEYGDITLPFLVLRRLDCILDEDGRKEIAINTYNEFKDKVSDEMLPPIILRAINTSFYNTSQYDLSRLKDDPNYEDIDEYYHREVKPHVPDSWIDRERDKIGYEINFNRYFYQYTPLRSLKEIADEMLELERKSEGLLNEVLGL